METQRDYSNLTNQLIGLEGWRVEVMTKDCDIRRFIVGISTGIKPIHLEIKTKRSLGGEPAEKEYFTVKRLEKVRG